MLELLTPYTFSQVPNIAYEALDQYAEAVVRDAMPDKLTTPCPIDIAWFLEIYLGMEVMYRRLSYDRQIQAMTAFNSGFVQVCDEVTGKPEPLYVKAGTAIFDPVLLLKRNAHRHRFSYGHEGSHYLIHRPAFAKDNPFGSVGKFENQYLAAKEGRIDYSRSQKERTDSDRIERQADFLSSALLMPKPTLRMAYRNFFKYYEDKPRRIIRGVNALDDSYAVLLPAYISQTFCVSKRAALIRLEKLTAIVDKHSYWGYA